MVDAVECVVVGAGVVGLAAARQLARKGKEVLILEKEQHIGQHSSSRNSEVIHAGIYYPPQSAKAKHCLRGKEMLYEFCQAYHVAHRRIGKLLVATSVDEIPRLEQIKNLAAMNGMTDLHWLSEDEIKEKEPQLSAIKGLYSPTTGIVDTHGLMLALLGDAEHHGAITVFHSNLQAGKREGDWINLTIATPEESMMIKTKMLVNCAGLWASEVMQSIQGIDEKLIPTIKYCRGNYFSCNHPSPFSHLIYPIPQAGGLGIHSTLDLNNQTRFGPDVEWIDEIDYQVNASHRLAFVKAIQSYWPAVTEDMLEPTYSGIRPKYLLEDKTADFYIQTLEDQDTKIVSFYGIESPGITSCLSLASLL